LQYIPTVKQPSEYGMQENMQEILKIGNLQYQYPSYPGLDFPKLLNGINLTVNSGDFIVIMGKPETGKSTLLKIILSLILKQV